jgi:predicted nucleic acid-binding protein
VAAKVVRVHRPSPNPKVLDWLSANEEHLVVDPLILGELCIGFLGLAAGRKRARLEQWFEALVQTIECLPWTAAVSRRWARLVVALRKKGTTLPVLDAMIAATALEYGLTVVTRNVGVFKHAGLRVVNPFV